MPCSAERSSSGRRSSRSTCCPTSFTACSIRGPADGLLSSLVSVAHRAMVEDHLMVDAPLPAQPSTARAWLLSAEPSSRWQARLGRGYLGWRAFTRNPLAVLGLGIVVLLTL